MKKPIFIGSVINLQKNCLYRTAHTPSLGGLSFALPPTICQKIKATPFPLAANSMDRITWASSPNGDFELKEAYKLACMDNDNYPYGYFTGQWVWKTITLPKIKCFLWWCLHKSIPIREVLAARGLNVLLCCPICNFAAESILHLLRDCPQVWAFWDSFSPPIHSNLFFGANLSDWLKINCTSHKVVGIGISWGIIFPFGVWSLWLQWNRVIFRDHTTLKPIMAETLAKVLEFAYLGLNERRKRTTCSIQVRWIPPPENWFKLIFDGSFLGNLGKASGGGIIRNCTGNWVRGYARVIGHTTSVAAELWALRDGINLCIDLNLTNVLIELDVKIVVDLLLKGEEKTHGNDVLIADRKEGLKKISSVQIQHCYREANKCTDTLTRRGALLSQDFVIFHSPPANVALLVGLDAVGTMYE